MKTIPARIYACIFPEDALLRDSVAQKLTKKRFLGTADLEVTEGGSIVYDPAPYQRLLREGEELSVEFR